MARKAKPKPAPAKPKRDGQHTHTITVRLLPETDADGNVTLSDQDAFPGRVLNVERAEDGDDG